MDTRALDKILLQTLDDLRLSRAEKHALKAWLDDVSSEPGAMSQARSRAFVIARERVAADPDLVVRWLEDVVKVTVATEAAAVTRVAEAWFSPGEGCRNRIAGLLGAARKSADICVFTITDDLLSDAVVAAHARGVRVRVITDNDKSEDRGSDVATFVRRGLDVRIDETAYHMHHKFAVFDDRLLMTGSYNWTRSAFQHNEENIVVIDNASLVKRFAREFEQLWASLK